jgi:hypothetical protein
MRIAGCSSYLGYPSYLAVSELSIHAGEARKGGRSMHTLHLADTLTLKTLRGRPVEDVVYQVMTVGAILLVLGTLWAF